MMMDNRETKTGETEMEMERLRTLNEPGGCCTFLLNPPRLSVVWEINQSLKLFEEKKIGSVFFRLPNMVTTRNQR